MVACASFLLPWQHEFSEISGSEQRPPSSPSPCPLWAWAVRCLWAPRLNRGKLYWFSSSLRLLIIVRMILIGPPSHSTNHNQAIGGEKTKRRTKSTQFCIFTEEINTLFIKAGNEGKILL